MYHRSRAFCSSSNIPEDLLLYKYLYGKHKKYIEKHKINFVIQYYCS